MVDIDTEKNPFTLLNQVNNDKSPLVPSSSVLGGAVNS